MCFSFIFIFIDRIRLNSDLDNGSSRNVSDIKIQEFEANNEIFEVAATLV